MTMILLIEDHEDNRRIVRDLVTSVGYELASVPQLNRRHNHDLAVVVDRLVVRPADRTRLNDSIETAFQKGLGRCVVVSDDDTRTFYRAWRCAHCGRPYPEPDPEEERRAAPFLATLTAFLRRVDSDMIDRTGEIPEEYVQELREMGAFGIKIPKE